MPQHIEDMQQFIDSLYDNIPATYVGIEITDYVLGIEVYVYRKPVQNYITLNHRGQVWTGSVYAKGLVAVGVS